MTISFRYYYTYLDTYKSNLRSLKVYLKQYLIMNMTNNVLVLSMETIFQAKIYFLIES